MDAALVTSALLMGLAGGPHCVAMCGAAFAAVARPSDGVSGAACRVTGRGVLRIETASFIPSAALGLHAGRIAGYAAAGALVSSSVGALVALQAAAPVLRPAWTLLQVGALALGAWLAWSGKPPAWFGRLGRSTQPGVRPSSSAIVRLYRRVPAAGRAGLVGVCWAGLPCGLLQSALLVAALASGPAAGAAVMVAFAAGSGVSLWLGPRLWQRLQRGAAPAAGGPDREARLAVRVAGVLLAGAALFALWHGLGSAIAQALCAAP